MTAASSPMPAIAVKGLPSAIARSIRRSLLRVARCDAGRSSLPAVPSTVASAALGCAWMPSVFASRLAVPCGTIPSGVPVPASPSAQPRTVPSPPTATTRSAPSSAAARAAAIPLSAFSVTRNSAVHPARAANSRHSGTNRPLTRASEPLTTNDTVGIAPLCAPAAPARRPGRGGGRYPPVLRGLWRQPVKDLRERPLDRLHVGPHGVEGIVDPGEFASDVVGKAHEIDLEFGDLGLQSGDVGPEPRDVGLEPGDVTLKLVDLGREPSELGVGLLPELGQVAGERIILSRASPGLQVVHLALQNFDTLL